MVTIEKPQSLSAADVRDRKVELLKCIKPITLDNCVFGQYVASNIPGNAASAQGYLDDPTVPKGSKTPTYAMCVVFIDNDRWRGVPFIMQAGKALDEGKVDVRIQFKDETDDIFSKFETPDGVKLAKPPRNEFVVRLQPDEAVYMKMNIKKPGVASMPVQTELDLTYKNRFAQRLPDAYERLIINAMTGNQSNFVRSDELAEAWRIFTPMLHAIARGEGTILDYPYGSRGPVAATEMAAKHRYEYNADYKWGQDVGDK